MKIIFFFKARGIFEQIFLSETTRYVTYVHSGKNDKSWKLLGLLSRLNSFTQLYFCCTAKEKIWKFPTIFRIFWSERVNWTCSTLKVNNFLSAEAPTKAKLIMLQIYGEKYSKSKKHFAHKMEKWRNWIRAVIIYE